MFIPGLLLAAALTTAAASPPAPLAPVPSPRQLAWHVMEYCAIIDFGLSTFTDAQDPSRFTPTALDSRQWARVCRDAGMSGIIITAKNRNGFCLWPSKLSDHTVAAGPWRDGEGDVLRELSDACREFGLSFGVTMSPGAGTDPRPKPDDDFRKQLEEVLTRYGRLFEVRFDGADARTPGLRSFVRIVRRHQPKAVIASNAGPDVRATEVADETSWSMLRRDGTQWMPAERIASIRAGEDDAVVPLEQLLDVYDESVGRNAALLLRLPVDRRGLIPEDVVARLTELRKALDDTFDDDLALGGMASASQVRGDWYDASRAVDGDPETYWATDDGMTRGSITLDFDEPIVFNRVALGEYIPLGQRVEAFSVERWDDGAWTTIGRGTTIGRTRILRVPGSETTRLRVTIQAARACPTISTISVYAAPPRVSVKMPANGFLERASVPLVADLPSAEIHYTLDGSTPTPRSTRYTGPISLRNTATISAIAVRGSDVSPAPIVRTLKRWTRDQLLDPILFVRQPDPGLRFAYHEGEWQSVRDVPAGAPDRSGIVERFDLEVRARDESFALVYDGAIVVPKDGVYTFWLVSDDGSRLAIGGRTVVDNDGLRGAGNGMLERSGDVGLKAGYHQVRLTYFNGAGMPGLEVWWAGPGAERAIVPADVLGH